VGADGIQEKAGTTKDKMDRYSKTQPKEHGQHLGAGFSIDLNFQDVMTSELKNLAVNVQNLEVIQ